MKNESKQLDRNFLRNWILANGIGWLVGFIGALILSYLVVNIFYDKETNLIVGLCVGASIGYAQWFVLKREFKISSMWGLVCTLCLGIPFIIGAIMNENDYTIPYFQGDYEILGRLLFGLIVGSVIGLLQMQFLKPYFNKASRWILASSVGWGIGFLTLSVPLPLATLAMILGGVLLGVVTGYSIIWMNKSES